MKIICLNIIGELINKEEVGVVCLQETKLEIVNKERCYNIRNNDIEWEHFVVVNGLQEILTMWHKDTFICETLVINTSFFRG